MSRSRSHCCWKKSFHRTFPEVTECVDKDPTLLEIRPGRWLRVFHINPKFNNENARHVQSSVQRSHSVSKKHVSFSPEHIDSQQDIPLPHFICDERSSDSSTTHTNKGTPDSGIKNRRADAEPTRGHSSASVAVSLQSRQSSAPSAHLRENLQNVVKSSPTTSPTHLLKKHHTPHDSETEVVLFFIHGVGGSADVWKAQLDFFSQLNYEIVATDLIGHGYSWAPLDKKAYHFQEISKDMETIFDKFSKKRNVIIGHSYGCSFAAMLARKRSRRVNKIVLISGGGPTPLAPQPGVFSLPSCLLSCLRPCLNTGFHKSAFHKASKVHVPKDEVFHIPTYVLSHTMNGQHWPEGDDVFHNWLNVSTLLIYGRHDKLITLEEEKAMAETIYGSQLEVVEAASHMVMMEQPDIVNQLILDFLLSDMRMVGHEEQGDFFRDETLEQTGSHHSVTSL